MAKTFYLLLSNLSVPPLCLCVSVVKTLLLSRRASPAAPSVGSSWDVEAREYLGTPQSEAAVNKGLAYLATHQLSDGHWDSRGIRNDTGITGLCLMAFLAAGHQPGRGRYGVVLSEAVDWLASSVHMDGQFTALPALIRAAQGREPGRPMYGHGFAPAGAWRKRMA